MLLCNVRSYCLRGIEFTKHMHNDTIRGPPAIHSTKRCTYELQQPLIAFIILSKIYSEPLAAFMSYLPVNGRRERVRSICPHMYVFISVCIFSVNQVWDVFFIFYFCSRTCSDGQNYNSPPVFWYFDANLERLLRATVSNILAVFVSRRWNYENFQKASFTE